MKASIYNAAFGSSAAEVPTVCPTTSCTWNDYTSLGICSSCKKVTQSLQTEDIGNDTQRLYLPNGASLASKVDDKLVWLNVSSSLLMSYDGMEPSALVPRYSLAFNDSGYMSIMNIFSIARGEQAEATECVLYWCTRRYRSNFSDGQLQESTLSTWHNKSGSWWSPSGSGAKGYHLQPPEGQGDFLVSQAGHLTMTWTMQALYQGSGYTFSNESRSVFNWIFYESDVLASFHIAQRKGQLADYFENLAQGISLRLRIGVTGWRNSSVSGDLDPVRGTAWEIAETYVNVRWRWFAFPVALQFLAWFVVCRVFFETRLPRRRRIWKSSALATLFHGLSPSMSENFESLPLLSSMDETAKATTVTLVHRDGGSWLEGDHPVREGGGVAAAT